MKTKSIKKNLTTFVLSILIIIIAVLLLTGIPEKEPNSVILSLTALAILIGVPIFIILFIFLAYVDRVIIKPIHVLVESVKQVSEGNYDTYIEVNREDEIGVLAENFNQMITSLKEYREKEIIEKEVMQFIGAYKVFCLLTNSIVRISRYQFRADWGVDYIHKDIRNPT